jgi:hypothetical protein
MSSAGKVMIAHPAACRERVGPQPSPVNIVVDDNGVLRPATRAEIGLPD